MKAIRTIKLKIDGKHPEWLDISVRYNQAANWLSNIVFNSPKIKSANNLQRSHYATIRSKFKLPSQVTCSLFRHVVGSYKSMKSNGEWHLAIYKKTTIPMGWRRDFNVSQSGFTVWGEPITFKSREIPKGPWADSKLKLIKSIWYLCLTVEIDVPESKTTGTIVGMDSGIRNIAVAVDLKSNATHFSTGSTLNHNRLCIRQTRKQVASVGTRSRYRLLKRLSGREKAVTQQFLHTASKQLVAWAVSVNAKTIVMEDLTGIRKGSRRGNKKKHHKQRAANNRWPFAMFQFFVTYKAAAVGISVEFVQPRNTSRNCPKCGHCEEANRNGSKFLCKSCKHQDNADRNGAINIALRSLFQRTPLHRAEEAVGERGSRQLPYSSHEGRGANELQAPSLVDGVI